MHRCGYYFLGESGPVMIPVYILRRLTASWITWWPWQSISAGMCLSSSRWAANSFCLTLTHGTA